MEYRLLEFSDSYTDCAVTIRVFTKSLGDLRFPIIGKHNGKYAPHSGEPIVILPNNEIFSLEFFKYEKVINYDT